MEKNAKILVLGARGLVGSALVAELRAREFSNILVPAHSELDLTDAPLVKWYFSCHCPEYVFFCAAKVGGIADNAANKVDFLVQNLQMELNVITNAAEHGCKKLLFVGTSCVYPRDCPQPIREEDLLTGPLEATTEAYSIAKIAGIKLCQYFREQWGENFITALPCNIFGENDNFDFETAHCLPGMLARMVHAQADGARAFEVWGDGTACREFLYSGDLASALYIIMDQYEDGAPINTGSGHELSIRELAQTLKEVTGYEGELVFNTSRPSGTPRKLLDNSKLRALGWSPHVGFVEGLRRTYRWYVLNKFIPKEG